MAVNFLIIVIIYVSVFSFSSCDQSRPILASRNFKEDSTLWTIEKAPSSNDENVKYVDSKWRLISKETFMDSVLKSNFAGVSFLDKDRNRLMQLKHLSKYTKDQIVSEYSASDNANKILKTEFPDFSFTNLAGDQITKSMLLGKIVVINYWFIGCKGCISEIDSLNELVEKYKNNTEVVFIAPSTDAKNELISFLLKKNFKFEVVTMENGSFIYIPSFPMHLIIDQNGYTRFMTTGGGNFIGSMLSLQIDKYLSPSENLKVDQH